MLDWAWMGSVGAGAICLGAGMLAWGKSPNSLPAGMFLASMTTIFMAMITSPLYGIVDQAHAEVGATIAKVSVISTLLAFAFLLDLSLMLPVERKIIFLPPNRLGVIMIAVAAIIILLGSTATLSYSDPASGELSEGTSGMVIMAVAVLALSATGICLYSRSLADRESKRSALIFLVGVWLLAVSGLVWVVAVGDFEPLSNVNGNTAELFVTAGVAVSGLLFGVAIARGQMMVMTPATERSVSGSKAKLRLLHRYAYLVEEAKPNFAFKMFSDILTGRCYDCENDDSFSCESLECSACSLPCPCRQCTKYRSRPQGMIVTRQFPKDVRSKYYFQTTPIIWLSTVAGKDNMDPAKLSLLTDYLVSFMEKSQNGVVIVDGLEYLVTSNDFSRMLRAVDRWTETAMVSNSRLILSIDQRAFDARELAMLERNRETVRPDATEAWKVIPEPV